MSLRRLVDGLTEANVSFVIVGMVAGQLYGSRIATYDLDIVYEESPQNIERLVAFLVSADAYVKETWPNEGMTSDFSSDRLRRERSLTLGTREGELDVLHRIDGIQNYARLRELSRPIRLENGREAYVIVLRALIASKRASDREKDRLHILELEALEEMLSPFPAES